MKRIMKMVFGLTSACMLTGCGTQTPSDNESIENNSHNSETEHLHEETIDFTGDNVTYESHGNVKGSIHQLKHEKTDKYVLRDGKTEYVVVVPDNSSINLQIYARDFVNLFEEATNVRLEIVNESNYTNNGKYFSIGNTDLFKNSNIGLDYETLKSQGYVIKTINDAIYINGFTDASCIYGIYQYLSFVLDYDFFGPGTYHINKNVTDINLENYDVIDAPDIEFRMPSCQFANGVSLRRYRLTVDDPFMSVGGGRWHNTFNYLPKDKYESSHPEWYSDDGTQLCYTAHGNQESLDLMIETVANTIKQTMTANPTKTVITFTIQDSNTFCNCQHCRDSRTHYNGSNAAVIVKFLNKVSDNIHEWYKTPEGSLQKRDLKILFFAYLSTNIAPTTYDATTDTFTPVDNEVLCNDDVVVFFADVRGDYTHSYYDTDSANAMFIQNMRAWQTCSKEFFFWMYSTNFSYYLTPYNNFDAMQDTYKFAVENNTRYIFDQGQWNQGQSSTGWSILKQYINSKLTWDVNQNQDELIDKFFKYFYSEYSGDIMKNLFDEYRVVAKYQNEFLGYSGESSIYHNPLKSDYWPKNTLLRWIEMLDTAIARLSPVTKSNPGMYDTYLNNIKSERVAYVYLLLKIYSATLSEDELTYYKKIFHEDTNETGMLYENEPGTLVSDILK